MNTHWTSYNLGFNVCHTQHKTKSKCLFCHMGCSIASLKNLLCVLLSSILRDSPQRRVERKGVKQTPVPNRAAHIETTTDRTDRLFLSRDRKPFPNCRLPTHDSYPRGKNVTLPNANSVRSYGCYFPGEKCQMEVIFCFRISQLWLYKELKNMRPLWINRPRTYN